MTYVSPFEEAVSPVSGYISPFTAAAPSPASTTLPPAYMTNEEFDQWIRTAPIHVQGQYANAVTLRRSGVDISPELIQFYGGHIGRGAGEVQESIVRQAVEEGDVYEDIIQQNIAVNQQLESIVRERQGWFHQFVGGAEATLGPGLRAISWPGHLGNVAVNSIYEAFRPGRTEETRLETADRIFAPLIGEDFETLHTDIQSVLWAGTVPLRAAVRLPIEMATSAAIFSGDEGWMQVALENTFANEARMAEVFSGEPYIPEDVKYLEQQISLPERFARQFVTESLTDPLTWFPIQAGYRAARTGRGLGNALQGWTVNPRSGEILDNFTTLERGLRKPTLGEYVGWGTNRINHAMRTLFDPHNRIRQALNSARRAGGAEGVLDYTQTMQWEALLQDISTRTGISYEELSASATRIIEEELGAQLRVLRNAPEPGMRGSRVVEDIEGALVQEQRMDPLQVGEGPYVSRPTGGVPDPTRPQQIGLFTREPVTPSEYRPLETGYREIIGGQRPVAEEAFQFRLFGTPEEQARVIDDVIGLQEEMVTRGWAGTSYTRQQLAEMTMPQLQRHLIDSQTNFINRNARHLAGIDRFRERVIEGETIGDITGPDRFVNSVIRSGVPALRDAPDDVIEDYAKVLYEAAYDTMNVGPRAPLAREAAAGLLTDPLASHYGYVEHIQADQMLDAYVQAAKLRGRTVSRAGASNELGSVIAHGSTRQRGYRGSINEGNTAARDGRAWMVPGQTAADKPTLRILPEGQRPPPGNNWVRVDQMFNDDLPNLMIHRRLSATRAVGGLQYLDTVMNDVGRYSPTGRPQGWAERPYLRFRDDSGNFHPSAGAEVGVPTTVWELPGMSYLDGAGIRRPTNQWTQTFGKLTPEMQNRLVNTYFPDADYARATLRWYEISQGSREIIEGLAPVVKMGFSMLRQYNTYFKAKTLFPFTSYWFRNFYDDYVRASTWVDGMMPNDVSDGFKTIYHGRIPPHVREYVANLEGILPEDVTVDQLLYHLRREGLFEAGIFYDEIDDAVRRGIGDPDQFEVGNNAIERLRTHGLAGVGQRFEGWAHHPTNPFSTNFIADQAGKQFGRDSANMVRLGATYAAMRSGRPLEEVGELVRRALIDYADVDPVTGFFRETGISPFITFQRHAIPQNIAAITRRPQKIIPRLRALRIGNDLIQHEYGEDEQPSWSDTIMYRVGRDLWFRPNNFDSVFDIGEIINTFSRFIVGRDEKEGFQFIAENTGPVVTELPEQLFNYDLYTGKPVYDERAGRDIPEFFRALGLSEEGSIRAWHAISTIWRGARLIRPTAEVLAGEDVSGLKIERAGIGIPLYGQDPDINTHYMMQDNEEMLGNIGMEVNQYGSWNTYSVPPEQVGNAATRLFQRLAIYYASDMYLSEVPYTGAPRAFAEGGRDESGYYQESRLDMLADMKRDIRGLWALQDRADFYLENGRLDEDIFTEGELDFLNNLMASVLMTEMGVIMMALQEGEIDERSAGARMRPREKQLQEFLQ